MEMLVGHRMTREMSKAGTSTLGAGAALATSVLGFLLGVIGPDTSPNIAAGTSAAGATGNNPGNADAASADPAKGVAGSTPASPDPGNSGSSSRGPGNKGGDRVSEIDKATTGKPGRFATYLSRVSRGNPLSQGE